MKPEIAQILIPPSTKIKDVFEVINRGVMKIALVVDEEGKFIGIVTDGDLRRAIIRNLDLDQQVRSVMNSEPVAVSEKTAEHKVVELMKSHSIEQIPVLDGQGRPIDVMQLSKLMKENKIIPLCEPSLGHKELEYVMECIQTNWISSVGPFVEKFERNLADFVGAKYAVATCNGTAAIHTALIVSGIGPGDEVIVPTLTFVATVNPVLYVGAVPVFVDSEPETWNIDPAKIEQKITSRTKAIIPVHLYGHPANMQPIMELSEKYGLVVIEDATEALGAKCYGKNVGTFGKMSCFSFNGNKLITTGGGGMIVTDDPEIADRARFLTSQAKEDGLEYYHSDIGYNYRLSNIQAAVGLAQLEKADDHIQKKRENAMRYSELLRGNPEVTTCGEQQWAFSTFWMYSILIEDEGGTGLNRSALLNKLNSNDIQARPFFRPIHTLPCYQKANSDNITVADEIYRRGINLPCSVTLRSEDIERIVDLILDKRYEKSGMMRSPHPF